MWWLLLLTAVTSIWLSAGLGIVVGAMMAAPGDVAVKFDDCDHAVAFPIDDLVMVKG